MAFVTRAYFRNGHVLQSEGTPPTSWRVTTAVGVVVTTFVVSSRGGSADDIDSKEISNKSWKDTQLRTHGGLRVPPCTNNKGFIRKYWDNTSSWDNRNPR